MLLKEFTSVLLGLFLFSTVVDARSQESLTLRVFSPDTPCSNKQLFALLKTANLVNHGYKKEITTKLVSEPGNDTPIYHKAYLYHKIVNCSRVQEIVQELQTLFPGPYSMEVGTKFNREFKARNLSNMKQCKAGMEVHLKVDGGSSAVKKSYTRRQKRNKTNAPPCPCYCCEAQA